MKVLFVMNGNFSSHGTSEHLLKAVIEALAKDGNQVVVLQMLKSTDELSLPESLSALGVKTDGIKVISSKKDNLVSRYLHAIQNYRNYSKLLKNNSDADAVFLQSTNVAGIAVWLVRKYIKKAVVTYNVQDILPYNLSYSGKLKKNSLVFKVLAAIQRYGYNHSDHIITISEDMKDTLVADGVEASKIEVVYNWSYQDGPYENVDLNPVANMFNKNFFNLVYAGNIGVMQNVDIVIEAAKLMKDDNSVWFHIIGNGVYKEKLEAKAKEYEIKNISFWPMQPSELAPAIYSAADVNVIPLVKDVFRTALPSKTATCFACGKPVVFAIGKESKFGQKVMNETGCPVVESDDAKELADAIKAVKRGEIKCETKEFFKKNMSISANSRKYGEIIERKN